MVAGPFFLYLFFLKLDAPRLEIIDPPKVLAKSNLFLQFSFVLNFKFVLKIIVGLIVPVLDHFLLFKISLFV